jgi:septum formation protein
MRIVLASASPRRAELLTAAGYQFDVVAVDVDERPRAGEAAREYVQRLASEKSAAAQALLRPAEAGRYAELVRPAEGERDEEPGLVILAADTTVVVDRDILGKPRDDDEAAAMLRRLSGRRHEVMTAVSVRGDGRELNGVETTTVEFLPLSESDIAWYLSSGEGRDKAGAYGIQGLASRFVPRIDGSYSNVVGLPVAFVHQLLGRIASAGQSGYSEGRTRSRKSL